MSRKKGLSLEEKRSRMMEIFFESKDVFQLKDIEKIAPKTKGIAPMTVKDVLQGLVDDGLVQCERVGTSNYYWAFTSCALHTRTHTLGRLRTQLCEAKQRKQSTEEELEQAKVGRQDTEQRSALQQQLQVLREERSRLQEQLHNYRECDPQVVEQMRRSNAVAQAAVSRWTDNVFSIKSWTKKKFSFDDGRMNKAFGIPEDFDYLD